MGGRRRAAPRKGREKAKLGLRGAGGRFDLAKMAESDRRPMGRIQPKRADLGRAQVVAGPPSRRGEPSRPSHAAGPATCTIKFLN